MNSTIHSIRRNALTIGLLTIVNPVLIFSQQASFHGLGFLPGGYPASTAYAVSADGMVVVGEAWNERDPVAFRWSVIDSTMSTLGSLP